MESKKISTKNKPSLQHISDEVNFYLDAQEFLNSQLPDSFDKEMMEYCKNKKYKQNDYRLFASYLKDYVGFRAISVFLDLFHKQKISSGEK